MAIRLEWEGRLARVQLARPPLNILDLDHLGALGDRLEECRDAAVVVIDGSGARTFCAGNDIRDHTPDRAPRMLEAFHRAVGLLRGLDAITVAQVAGDALGAGCELVACCDLVYASPEARFGQPEIDLGCFPPVAAAMLPRRIGWTHAVEMIATGRPVDAATAVAWGLVTAVGEPPLAELLAKSPAVLRLAKRALREGGLEQAQRLYTDELLGLDDCAEGVRAFLAKRAPRWRE